MSRLQRMLWSWLVAALIPGILMSFYLYVATMLHKGSIFEIIELFASIMFQIFILASAHILFLGLPLFYVLERRNDLDIWIAAFAGGLIASIVSGIIIAIKMPVSWWHTPIAIISGFWASPLGVASGISAWCVWRYTAPKEITTETIP